jgi:hypothetical protein
MNLQEFLNKWGDGTRKLENTILVAFEKDPRTVSGWKRETPGHIKVSLGIIDRYFTEKGKPDYGVFFD